MTFQRVAPSITTLDRGRTSAVRPPAAEPAEALAAGVVDEVVDPDKVLDAAKTWIKTKGDPVARWDKKDFKIPGGGPYHPAGAQVFIMGNALLRKGVVGHPSS